MACGVPVIGSSSGAIPERIGDAGLIFPEGNALQLADKIQMLIADMQLRKDLFFPGTYPREQNYSLKKWQKLNQHLSEVMQNAHRD